jgi:hypothetical protein
MNESNFVIKTTHLDGMWLINFDATDHIKYIIRQKVEHHYEVCLFNDA